MRWIRYAALLGILTALVSASSADARPWPDTWDGIHIGLVFDYKVRTAPSKGQGVDVVFGADQPRGPFRSVNSRYVPFDRELVIHPIRWWRKHHPTWVVYRCDRRTSARQVR